MKGDSDDTVRPVKRIKRGHDLGSTMASTLAQQRPAIDIKYLDNASECMKRAQVAAQGQSIDMGTSTSSVTAPPQSSIPSSHLSRHDRFKGYAKNTSKSQGKRPLTAYATARTGPSRTEMRPGSKSFGASDLIAVAVSESPTASSPDFCASLDSVPLRLRGGMIMENTSFINFDQSKSKKIVEAYNAASQILEDTAGRSSPTYITPYGDPQDNYVTPYGPLDPCLDSSVKDNQENNSNRAVRPETTATHGESTGQQCVTHDNNHEAVYEGDYQDHEVDYAQVDRLLLLAGGGSLTDDDDTEDELEVLASFVKAEPDEDVQAILNAVCETMASGGSNSMYPTTTSKALVGAIADLSYFGLDMKQAANVRSLMDQAGIMKNIIIPKDQALVTSRLYATLSSRAQSSFRPGRTLLPYLASNSGSDVVTQVSAPFPTANFPHKSSASGEGFSTSYGGNMNGGIPYHFHGNFGGGFIPHMVGNQRGFLVPHYAGFHGQLMLNGEMAITAPGPVMPHPPFIPSSMPPPPLPSRVGTARGKTTEEAKKIRDYGFPPLPSSRPGMRPGMIMSPAENKLEE